MVLTATGRPSLRRVARRTTPDAPLPTSSPGAVYCSSYWLSGSKTSSWLNVAMMSRRCRVDGVIRTSACGSAVIAGARGDGVAARALVAAVLCLGESCCSSNDAYIVALMSRARCDFDSQVAG
jgi:hypothetical protein